MCPSSRARASPRSPGWLTHGLHGIRRDRHRSAQDARRRDLHAGPQAAAHHPGARRVELRPAGRAGRQGPAPAMVGHFRSFDGKARHFLTEGAGGPSWYTEYNVLAGLSARSFGRFAYYVTQIAAGRVERGLPTALRRCGYRTFSIYPALGAFMSAKSFQTTDRRAEVRRPGRARHQSHRARPVLLRRGAAHDRARARQGADVPVRLSGAEPLSLELSLAARPAAGMEGSGKRRRRSTNICGGRP